MYAILRTKRLNTITAACAHNLRTKYAKNVDPKKSHLNQIIIDELGLADRAKLGASAGTYDGRLEAYYQAKQATIRDDSVLALEFVLTASPKFFATATPEQFEEWKQTQLDFLRKEFGDKVQFLVLHMDEKSPHFHAFISVEETKMHKYKNRYGQGEKLKTTLNADRFNPIYLQKLQDRYARANKKYGLRRGLRNSTAIHTTLKKFSREVEQFTKKADYAGAIDKIIKGIPSLRVPFTGVEVCQVADIRKHLAPVLNSIMKQAKAAKIANKLLPEKIELVNKLLEEIEQEKVDIMETKGVYRDAINTKQSDQALILEQAKQIETLEKEVKRLKDRYEPADDGGGDIGKTLHSGKVPKI